MSEAKYRKGGQITSLDQLAAQEFIYFNNQILHRGWFMSWQFRFTRNMLNAGRLFRADRRTDDG